MKFQNRKDEKTVKCPIYLLTNRRINDRLFFAGQKPINGGKKYSFSLFRTMKLFETVKEYKKTGRQSAISYAEKQYKKAMKQGESTLAVVYIDLSCRLRMYTDEEFDGMNGGDNN